MEIKKSFMWSSCDLLKVCKLEGVSHASAAKKKKDLIKGTKKILQAPLRQSHGL